MNLWSYISSIFTYAWNNPLVVILAILGWWLVSRIKSAAEKKAGWGFKGIGMLFWTILWIAIDIGMIFLLIELATWLGIALNNRAVNALNKMGDERIAMLGTPAPTVGLPSFLQTTFPTQGPPVPATQQPQPTQLPQSTQQPQPTPNAPLLGWWEITENSEAQPCFGTPGGVKIGDIKRNLDVRIDVWVLQNDIFWGHTVGTPDKAWNCWIARTSLGGHIDNPPPSYR